MKRAALWVLAILLASSGGAALHAGIGAGGDGAFGTFLGLACFLSGAAIYWHKLRIRQPPA